MSLENIKAGDCVFVGQASGDLEPATVDSATKFYFVIKGSKFKRDTGKRVSADKWSRYYAYPATRALCDAWDLRLANRAFEKSLAIFRSIPQTRERLLEVLRVLDPEAWKIHGP